MYDACEPLLMLGGKVHRDMIITLDDIKKGLWSYSLSEKIFRI